jgi:hypothetical protein
MASEGNDNRFRKAWDSLNSLVIDIENLPKSRNGKSCKCVCVECKEPLDACQGFIRAWYFRHQSSTNCKGGPMTALHLLAQQLLVGSHTIKTLYNSMSYSDGSTEVVLTDSKFKADVLGNLPSGAKLVIEIFVSHLLTEEKYKFLKENKIHSIEIDLSKVDPDITEEDLLELLLNDTSKQRVIYLPENEGQTTTKTEIEPKSSTQKPWYEDFMPLIIIGIVALFFYLLGQRQKSRKVWRKRRRS